jgi:membrane associated rhomboid family serine protease
MLPLGDDDSTRRTFPLVTYALIVVNVLVFLLELSSGDTFINQWSFVPARFAANPGTDFLTIFSSMFMHAGWIHLGGNMLYLFIFGDNVEDRLGHLKYLIFYLLCGVIATFSQYMFNLGSQVPNLGASGAIAGVLGAYIVMFPGERVRVLMGYAVVRMSAVIVIGFWIVLQFISSLSTFTASSQTGGSGGGVAYFAHIGGFLAGILLTFFMGGRTDRRLTAGY